MTPGTKSGGGAEKDKHKAENDKNSAENDEIKVPKKVPKQVATGRLNYHYATDLTAVPYKGLFRLAVVTKIKLLLLQVLYDLF
jgi:hypothetical protein